MDTRQKESLSVDPAKRLRQLRKKAGLSLRALATRSGLSANALSVIERGKSSPSVSTLTKIAGALGVQVTDFLTQPETRKKVIFIKAGERTTIPFQGGAISILGGDHFDGHIRPYLCTLESGTESPIGLMHSGEMFFFCLSGNLEYQVEDMVYDLKAGDSLLLQMSLTHRWRSKGVHETKILAIVSEYTGEERLTSI